jgi:hypothetical protein
MTNLDPQTTADFWDAYLRAAGRRRPIDGLHGRPFSDTSMKAASARERRR